MSEVVKRQKKTYFPERMQIRVAPLQEAIIEYSLKAFPGRFRDKSDFIRVAVTQYAKTIMTHEEFEGVCSRGYDYHPAPTKMVRS